MSNGGLPEEFRQASEAFAAAADIGQAIFQAASSASIDEAFARLTTSLSSQQERRGPNAASSASEPPDALVQRTLEQMRLKGEKEQLERANAEKEVALEKERKEKDELAAQVARLTEHLMKHQQPGFVPLSNPPATVGTERVGQPTWAPSMSDGIANANRDEAYKALDIATSAFIDGDIPKAERFAVKAQGMHQSAEAADLLAKIKAAKPTPVSLGKLCPICHDCHSALIVFLIFETEERVAKLEQMGDSALKRLAKLERLNAGETQELKESILAHIQGSGNPSGGHGNQTGHRAPRYVMKLYDRLDNNSAAFLQWLLGAVSEEQPRQPNLSVATFVERLRQNPLFADSLRSILSDYIKDHTEAIIVQDSHDQRAFESMTPSSGQGAAAIQAWRQGSPSQHQSGPFKARFQPKDAWFIRFLEKLRDRGLLQDKSSPLGLYNKVIQVDTFNAQVRLYFKFA